MVNIDILTHVDTVNDDRMREVELFKALADPTRLRILKILVDQDGTISVEKLVELLDSRTQATVSHHLAILRRARLVQARKDGLWSYYSVRPETLVKARVILAQFQKEDI